MMKLAILGYGAEGKSIEKYFKTHPYDNVPPEDIEIKIFDNFTDAEIDTLGLKNYDVVFRSPSVRPHYDFYSPSGTEALYRKEKPYWTSATKYFFEHCPAEIIAVTGTKGKGTTCSMTVALLDAINNYSFHKSPAKHSQSGQNPAAASHRPSSQPASPNLPKTYLVGNIGVPALDVLDKITSLDYVVYEMSSFQLWDLHQSPFISVLLRIEPDHLNVHKDFDEYVYAKSAVTRYQTKTDHLVYFSKNPVTKKVATKSSARKLPYPVADLNPANQQKLSALLDCLTIPGEHNRENAEAALLAVSARLFMGDLSSLLNSEFYPALEQAFKNFQGLPHRCEFIRELNGVKYYDDNYSTNFPSLDVAIKTFENSPTFLIAGGKNKGTDITDIKRRIFDAKNVKKVILIGETAKDLAAKEDSAKYEFASSLDAAIARARELAESAAPSVVLMSPGFASFDMFESYGQRGELFQKLVEELS